MKEFFDTSVLVAAFIGDHPYHESSAKAFAGASKKHSYCGTHSLAELYSVLTRLPLKPMIAPAQAVLFIQEVRNRLTLVSLDETDYGAVIGHLAEQGMAGGRIYDALILRCAVKAKADVIYAWNTADFRGILQEAAKKIRTP